MFIIGVLMIFGTFLHENVCAQEVKYNLPVAYYDREYPVNNYQPYTIAMYEKISNVKGRKVFTLMTSSKGNIYAKLMTCTTYYRLYYVDGRSKSRSSFNEGTQVIFPVAKVQVKKSSPKEVSCNKMEKELQNLSNNNLTLLNSKGIEFAGSYVQPSEKYVLRIADSKSNRIGLRNVDYMKNKTGKNHVYFIFTVTKNKRPEVFYDNKLIAVLPVK